MTLREIEAVKGRSWMEAVFCEFLAKTYPKRFDEYLAWREKREQAN